MCSSYEWARAPSPKTEPMKTADLELIIISSQRVSFTGLLFIVLAWIFVRGNKKHSFVQFQSFETSLSIKESDEKKISHDTVKIH